MTDNHLYNSRIIKTFIEYLDHHYPELDIQQVLKEADIAPHEIEDSGHWLTQNQVDRFYEILSLRTSNPGLAREAGRHIASSPSFSLLRQYAAGFLSPAVAYWMLEKFAHVLSRHITLTTRKLTRNKIEITVTPKTDVKERPYQCENRIGMFEALAKVFTAQFAHVEHTVCIHKGDECCRYVATWETSPSHKLRNIGKYFLGCSLGLCFILSFYLSETILIASIFCLLCIYAFLLYWSERIEKIHLQKSIENQGNAADQLIDHINRYYNQALLIKEIGQASTSNLDIIALLNFIMSAFERYLDFDRGMIMLANENKTDLLYTAGFGYQSEIKRFLQQTKFHLDKRHSKGLFVLSFHTLQPFLVNNTAEIEKDVSPRSFEFAKKIGTKAFICVPIIFKGKSEGILAVDNIRTKRKLNETDLSLLMGIAPQIGICINNARAYEKLKHSEEKFRALSENAPDIIFTIDQKGFFNYVNPAWKKILGHPKEDIIGKHVTDFLRLETDVSDVFFNDLQKGRIGNTINGIISCTQATERFFMMNYAPNFNSNGKISGFIGTLKDITDIKNSEQALQDNYNRLQKAMQSTIDVVSAIVEVRDPYTAGHQRNVAKIACAVAKKLKLSRETQECIYTAALVHDIGKVQIPSEILNKPGKLSPMEFNFIKTHPQVGYDILKNIKFSAPIAEIILQHHERINGSGYPQGLTENDILFEAKIIAVADSIEAMISHRPYRPSLGLERTLEEISALKGVHYDHDIVDCCISLFQDENFTFEND